MSERKDRIGRGPEAGPLDELGSQAGEREGRDFTADPDAYWRANWAGRDYTDASRDYEYYRPAYSYGWEARHRHGDRAFEEVEEELRRGWDPARSRLEWDEARPAVRDAYGRRYNTSLSDPGNPLA